MKLDVDIAFTFLEFPVMLGCLITTLIREPDLSDLILYVPSTILQLNRDGSSWV